MIQTRNAIISRLRMDHGDPKQLVVTPLLDPNGQIGEGSIDLRLGTRFILFKQAEVPGVESGADFSMPQTSLEHVWKDFGEHFVLHPGQFALSDTLEFIALPRDVAGYVTSRSRFGRAGLVIATAIYIHPTWRGFLTLELQNYGSIPVSLECGSRIAQLILHESTDTEPLPRFACIPTGPSFPALRDPVDSSLLKSFRDAR